MEREKRIKIMIFLTVVFVFCITVAIIGIFKKGGTNEIESDEIKQNSTIEENINIAKIIYKRIKDENGLFTGTKFKLDTSENSLLIDEIVIETNITNIEIYSIDDLFLLLYKDSKDSIKLILYDENYNIILNSEDLLNEYANFYLEKYTLNESGIIIYLKNVKENCKEGILEIVFLYKYREKNKFDDKIILDKKDCDIDG